MATVIPSVTGGQVERWAPGDRITYTVTNGQTVRGGRLVELTASRTVQEAGAASQKVVGVALFDGVGNAAGSVKITVASEGVWLLLASGAIAAGDLVESGAAGVVVTVAAPGAGYVQAEATKYRTVVGRAIEAISNAQTGPVKLIWV